MDKKDLEQLSTDEELKLLLIHILKDGRECSDDDSDFDFDFDWIALLRKLKNSWKFVLIVVVFFAGLGVCTALLMKNEYTVTVTLAPEVQGRTSGSGSVGGLANMLGVGSLGVGGTNDALNIGLFPDISRSTPFLVSLFDVEVTPVYGADQSENTIENQQSMLLFDYVKSQNVTLKSWLKGLFTSKSKLLLNDSTINISKLTPKQNAVAQALARDISVSINKKTGVTSISVTQNDPQVATQLADIVCQRLQEYIISYRTKKAKNDLDYYTRLAEEAKEKMINAQTDYARSIDFDRSVILQSVNTRKERLLAEAQLAAQVYQQMESQKQAAKAKYQEMKPVFAVIQPASFPLKPSSTSRKIVVLVFAFVGFALSSAWKMFGEDFVKKYI